MSDPKTPEDSKAYCGAKNSQGKPCRRGAGWGTGHAGVGRCKLHGGRSPNAELSGQLVLARREAVVMGSPLPMEPIEAILQCIRIAAGEVRYASERIAELEERDAAGPVKMITDRPLMLARGEESPSERAREIHLGAPALNIWIRARHEAMDRLVGYSKVALAVGIAERQVRIAEGQAQLLAEAMRRFAIALGHDPAEPRVREGLRASLTVIAGGVAA